MMELQLLTQQGELIAGTSVNPEIFAREFNESLVHQVIVAYQANGRQGTRSQKTRAEVKHSTRKPWRQKGTGRARAGSTSSPIWRGGGRTFPNRPDENFTQKVNKKMYRSAMCSIYSQLARENRLQMVEAIDLDAPKTKLLAEKLKNMRLESVLFITDDITENFYLASRNLYNVAVVEAHEVSPLALVYFDRVLATKGALAQIEELLK
jgi:large subunit ribosomal protein L4